MEIASLDNLFQWCGSYTVPYMFTTEPWPSNSQGGFLSVIIEQAKTFQVSSERAFLEQIIKQERGSADHADMLEKTWMGPIMCTLKT